MDDTDSGIDGVARIQQRLIDLDYDLSSADGNYGPNTKGQVQLFQTAAKILVDGKVGQETWGRLFATTNNSLVTRQKVAIAVESVGITPYEADRTDTTYATLSWLNSRYPEITHRGRSYGVKDLTWDVFVDMMNDYIDSLPPLVINNYWIPNAKSEKTVVAYSDAADKVLNIYGYSESAVSEEFEVSADYLLMSDSQLVNYGKKEIFKTLMTAKSGSYSSQNIPLIAEVGMKITGLSATTGTTTMLITSLSRTTDVQQQIIETQISGNLIKSTGAIDSWV